MACTKLRAAPLLSFQHPTVATVTAPVQAELASSVAGSAPSSHSVSPLADDSSAGYGMAVTGSDAGPVP